MADGRFVVMTVKCEHCKAKQRIHVRARKGFSLMGLQAIPCIKCKKDFEILFPDKIVGGPFPILSQQKPANRRKIQ